MTDSPASFPKLVRDLMTVGVPTCSPDTPVSEIAQLMIKKGIEAVVVLNPADGHALGVVSQDDLVKYHYKSAK